MQVFRTTSRRIGTETRLVLGPRACMFSERAVMGGEDRLRFCPEELLEAINAGRYRVAMQAALLRFVALALAALCCNPYDFVPILPASVVPLTMLSNDDRQVPTPTAPVTLHGVGCWLWCSRGITDEVR